MVPVGGELSDVDVIVDEDSTMAERGIAVASIGGNLLAGGLAPNFGPIARALDDAADAAVDAAAAARRAVFSVGPYRPAASPLENHHGVLDVWAHHNVPGYVSRAADTPTVALTAAQHAATKAVYRDWLFARTGRHVGGRVDWTQVGAREIQDLAHRMFDAAGVPADARAAYFRAFNQYIYR